MQRIQLLCGLSSVNRLQQVVKAQRTCKIVAEGLSTMKATCQGMQKVLYSLRIKWLRINYLPRCFTDPRQPPSIWTAADDIKFLISRWAAYHQWEESCAPNARWGTFVRLDQDIVAASPENRMSQGARKYCFEMLNKRLGKSELTLMSPISTKSLWSISGLTWRIIKEKLKEKSGRYRGMC